MLAVSENNVHYKFNTHDSTPTKDAKNLSDNNSTDDLNTRQVVPNISNLSPTLGWLVSPYQLLIRQEVFRTGMYHRYSRDTRSHLCLLAELSEVANNFEQKSFSLYIVLVPTDGTDPEAEHTEG